jgi:putative ABC transport system ATP-binding protein
MTMVELDAVGKRYPGGVAALVGVDLAIGEGEQVAIVGPSGSGKSTLLHVMGTLEQASGGRLRVAGRDVPAMSDRELAQLRSETIGFVFQQFFLLDPLTALENVALGLLYRDMSRRERSDRARAALGEVGLADRVDHRPGELSGGERQRVAIARAVVGRPRLLFADEPTGNLDSRTGAQILELLTALAAGGSTLIVITHDGEIARGFPRQVVTQDGRIVSGGEPSCAPVM